MKRDFITLLDYSLGEISALLELSASLKRERGKHTHNLKDKTIGLVFQKPSNRTRVSFEVAVWQLGGNCLYLGPEEINLGKRESTSDVAQTLSRYLEGIVARTFSHKDILELSRYASVPVINGLSDLYHPCQALADLLSIKEKFGKLKGLKLAYIGDGNNVCNSLMIGSAKTGLNMSISTPKGYSPQKDILNKAKSIAAKNGSTIQVTQDPREATKKADIIYSDVWVSMGQEEETKKRLKDFQGFQINKELAKHANKNYIFMHCLPAHRGEEVTRDVIDGPHSIIFDQAENRLHAQKAILIFLFEGK